ncbi:MAG: hypothetical protein L0956_07880 [Candidatus Mariimomonas ferrooxydans]
MPKAYRKINMSIILHWNPGCHNWPVTGYETIAGDSPYLHMYKMCKTAAQKQRTK